MKRSEKPSSNQSTQTKRGHLFRVFLLYLFALLAFSGWIDISSFYVFNPWLLLVLSVIAALGFTYAHWRYGKRNPVDDLADGEL